MVKTSDIARLMELFQLGVHPFLLAGPTSMPYCIEFAPALLAVRTQNQRIAHSSGRYASRYKRRFKPTNYKPTQQPRVLDTIRADDQVPHEKAPTLSMIEKSRKKIPVTFFDESS